MSAPPVETTVGDVAPERDRVGGTLPRTVRDEVARRFMAEFGMTGATAVRYAKALLAAGSLDEFIAPEPPRKVLDLSRSELERLMREAPGGRHMNTKFAWREFGSTEGAWRVSS